MKKLMYILPLFLIPELGAGQVPEILLSQIEQNNPRIDAIRKWLDAGRMEARTGIFPDNPQITYIHLWGNREQFGDQQEFEAIQSFRFPGYYSSRSEGSTA